MLERGFHRPLLNTEIRRRGIYLLPNLFTTAALFAGFYSIVMAMNQRFDNAGAALRLARFNTNIEVVDKRFLQGLPSPAAAALVAGCLWLASDNKIPVDAYGMPWVAAFLTLYAGITMVSNVPFYSFKDINMRRSVPFAVILLIVLGFVLVSSDPPIVLFLMFVAYGLSGYAHWLWKKRKPQQPAQLQ